MKVSHGSAVHKYCFTNEKLPKNSSKFRKIHVITCFLHSMGLGKNCILPHEYYLCILEHGDNTTLAGGTVFFKLLSNYRLYHSVPAPSLFGR